MKAIDILIAEPERQEHPADLGLRSASLGFKGRHARKKERVKKIGKRKEIKARDTGLLKGAEVHGDDQMKRGEGRGVRERGALPGLLMLFRCRNSAGAGYKTSTEFPLPGFCRSRV